MKRSLINGESVEWGLLSTHSPDLDRIDYTYGVKLYDISGALMWQDQVTYRETHSMRRRGRYIKDVAPERLLARLMITDDVCWPLDRYDKDRQLALGDLMVSLRRARCELD